MPKISIITALLQGDENVYLTAESLIPELGEDIGWSIKYSHGTVPEQVRALAKGGRVEVLGEFDSSLYMGLNQALSHSEADYFLVIGAGDTVVPGALAMVLSFVQANSALDSFFFAVNCPSLGATLYPRPHDLASRMACPHPGTLLRTQKAKMLGGFDERYQIAADYDLISRYISMFPVCGWVDQVIVNYAGGGLSEKRALEGYLEEELIRMRVWKSPVEAVAARGKRLFCGGSGGA